MTSTPISSAIQPYQITRNPAEETSNSTKDEDFLKSCEDLINQNRIEEALKSADTIVQNDCKTRILELASIALLKQGQIGKAFRVAKTIPGQTTEDLEKYQAPALRNISKAVVDQGRVDEALKFIYALPLTRGFLWIHDREGRDLALVNIFKALIDQGFLNKAREVVNTIFDPEMQKLCFSVLPENMRV